MSSPIIEAVKKYLNVITPDDAVQLSLCYLMGAVHEDEGYIQNFYNILKKTNVLSDDMVGTIMKERKEGVTGAEAKIMETLLRDTENPAVSKIIELAMTYAMEVERHPCGKTT